MTDTLDAALARAQAAMQHPKKSKTNPRDKHRNPLGVCPDCGGTKLKRAMRCRPCANRARTGESRTDFPSEAAGRYRARRTRSTRECEYEGCTATGIDRHHVDGDPLNNDPSNIAVYCRRHHMMVDGRLQAAATRAPEIGKLGGRPKAKP
jgi:hypothetical protein